MDGEDLKRYLETQSRNLSETEFFALIFDMLENGPSKEARKVLEAYLLTYSYVDADRVARYLEKFLSDPNPVTREFTAFKLSIVAREPDSLAYKILRDFLKEEPVPDTIGKILKERLLKLSPHKKIRSD